MIDSAEDHLRREKEPIYWFNKASDLRGAAAALVFCMDNQSKYHVAEEMELGKGFDMTVATYSVYRMLCGMSFELLFKAIITANSHKVPKTHNLEDLASMAGLKIQKNDQAILAILTECIVWDGRYPVPKNHEESDYLAWLTYENLYTKAPFGKNGKILKPIEPNPLGWEYFSKLWSQASGVFWEIYS